MARKSRFTRPRRKPRLAKATGIVDTPAFKKAVLKVMEPVVMAKYLADQPHFLQAVPFTIYSTFPNVGLSFLPAQPENYQGVESHQRVGQKIRHVSGKTIFNFCLDANYDDSCDWFVRVYMVHPKQASSYSAFTSATQGGFLERGDNTQVDWDPPGSGIQGQQYAQYKMAPGYFVGSYKQIRLTKNLGRANNGLSSVTTIATNSVPFHGSQGHTIVWHWKHEGVLNYPFPTVGLPSNWCPVFCTVAWRVDGTNPSLTIRPVQTVRREMSFFDV